MACIIIVQAAPFGITNLNKGMGCNTWKDQPVKSFFLRSGWNLVIITLLQTTKDIKREDLRFFVWTKYWKSGFHVPIKPTSQFSSTKQILSAYDLQPLHNRGVVSNVVVATRRMRSCWKQRIWWVVAWPRQMSLGTGRDQGRHGHQWFPQDGYLQKQKSAKTLWWKAYGDQLRDEFGCTRTS